MNPSFKFFRFLILLLKSSILSLISKSQKSFEKDLDLILKKWVIYENLLYHWVDEKKSIL